MRGRDISADVMSMYHNMKTVRDLRTASSADEVKEKAVTTLTCRGQGVTRARHNRTDWYNVQDRRAGTCTSSD